MTARSRYSSHSTDGVGTARKIAIPAARTGREAIVILAEIPSQRSIDWAESKEELLTNHCAESDDRPESVFLILPNFLPSSPDGSINHEAAVLAYGSGRVVTEELRAWLVNSVSHILLVPPVNIDPDADWGRYGVDSAVVLELLGGLEEHLDIRLPQSLTECRSISSLAEAIGRQMTDAAELEEAPL